MYRTDQFHLKDTISTFSKRYGFEAPKGPAPGELSHNGKESRMTFEIFLEDVDYDNDDNPYGRLVFHQYSNMENVTDTKGSDAGHVFIDEEIPLVECNIKDISWRSKSKHYCPVY